MHSKGPFPQPPSARGRRRRLYPSPLLAVLSAARGMPIGNPVLEFVPKACSSGPLEVQNLLGHNEHTP